MKKISILLLSASLLLAGCSKKGSASSEAQEMILGRWWSMAGAQRVTMEFARDGTYRTTVGGQTSNGSYRWLDDTTIELNRAQKVKVTITNDELIMVIGNETSKFQREGQSAPGGGGISPAPVPTSSGGIIQQAVLARRIAPLSRSAVEVTDKFPVNQGSLWVVVTVANAPHDTHIKGVMIAVNAGNAIPPNTKLSENQSTTEGSENVGLGWPYSSAPAGAYRVDLYLNGTLDRSLPFSITSDAAPSSGQAASPAAVGACAAIPRDDSPPGFPIGVTLAQGRDGAGNPVNPGRILPPNATIYALLAVQNAPANTRLGARWFATDVGGADICNARFSSYEMTISGSGSPWFSVVPPVQGSRWPEGLYRVEIYVNGTKTLTTDFAVCDGACKFTLPFPS